jgi:hypothetical protein
MGSIIKAIACCLAGHRDHVKKALAASIGLGFKAHLDHAALGPAWNW